MHGGELMPFLLFVWSNKRWTIIILLLIYGFWKTWQHNDAVGDLRKVRSACETTVKTEIEKAIKPYKDAEKLAAEKAQRADLVFVCAPLTFTRHPLYACFNAP